MAKRQRKKRVETGFAEAKFFNDTAHPICVRKTQKSSRRNPEMILPLETQTLFIRPGGFIKLWDYGTSYHLLVE